MAIQWLRPLFAADTGSGGGGSEDDPDPTERPRASSLLEHYGRDAIRLAEKLADVQADNYRLREQRRDLRQQLKDVEARLPAEGARVLTSEEAAAYDAYRAIGAPEDVKQAIAARGGLEQELTALKRERAIAKAAEAAGYKAAVLTRLAGELDIQVKPGKDKAAVVVIEDGKEVPLDDYAAREWADFLPALKAGERPHPHDINAGARGNANGSLALTEEERQKAQARYRLSF